MHVSRHGIDSHPRTDDDHVHSEEDHDEGDELLVLQELPEDVELEREKKKERKKVREIE